jgi:transposase-like protein
MSDITAARYKNQTAARKYLERVRWPDGPVCPHCGSVDNANRITGKSARKGLWHCADCRKQFTVTVGTVFERSKIPLHKWLLATHLLCAGKKGTSAHQLHRMLGVTYKTAWFMAHRIRESMKDDAPTPMGGEGETLQADETYFGTRDEYRGKEWADKKGHSKKMSVVSLISGGKARTFSVKRADAKTVRELLVTNVSRDTELHTDESRLYVKVGHEFAKHRTVVHVRNQYVGPHGESTNKVENYFSIFKRGMRGVYQHCSEKHLPRYLSEFDFRYNTRTESDADRADKALEGIAGKRLTYRRPDIGAHV